MQKNLLAPVLLKIMLKLQNPISSCLSILSKGIGEVPYIKSLRTGNIYSRQKNKWWDQEKPYHAIIFYGRSKIYFQQYHVCTFFIYITNILSWVIIWLMQTHYLTRKVCYDIWIHKYMIRISTWFALINSFENHQSFCNKFVFCLLQS